MPADYTEAEQALAALDYMLVTSNTDYDAGTLHYSTAAALARQHPGRYVIERVGRQRRILRVPGPSPQPAGTVRLLVTVTIPPGCGDGIPGSGDLTAPAYVRDVISDLITEGGRHDGPEVPSWHWDVDVTVMPEGGAS
jgi:hypothetical protein